LSEPPEGQGGGPDIIGGGGCGRSSKGSSGDTSYDISAPSGHASNDSEIEMLNQGRGHFVCGSQREGPLLTESKASSLNKASD